MRDAEIAKVFAHGDAGLPRADDNSIDAFRRHGSFLSLGRSCISGAGAHPTRSLLAQSRVKIKKWMSTSRLGAS
jgi:hypothetical protein